MPTPRPGLLQIPGSTHRPNERFYESDDYRRIYGEEEPEHAALPFYRDAVDRSGEYHWRMYFEFARDLLPEIESVVEFGAESGRKLVPFMEAGKRCVGYDFSPTMVERGRKRGVLMVRADADGVVGSYDLLLMIHTLEHLLDPIAQLRGLRDNLADDGKLLIEVPGFVEIVPSIQNAHTYYFSPRTLESVLAKAGFAICNLQVISSNCYILALAKKDGPVEDSAYDGEYERVVRIVKRFRWRVARRLVATRTPPPLRRLRKQVVRTVKRVR